MRVYDGLGTIGSSWRLLTIVIAMSWLLACSAENEESPEPLTFTLEGAGCDGDVEYSAPPDAKLTLMMSPGGDVQAFYLGDGPIDLALDETRLNRYARDHALLSFFVLDEQTRLEAGDLGPVGSAIVMAEGLGSLTFDGTSTGDLTVTEFEQGRHVAVDVTLLVDGQDETYPEAAVYPCEGGEVRARFEGGYETWDGQDDCYSPTENLDRLETDPIVGCACDPEVDESVCVTVCADPDEGFGQDLNCSGWAVALFCVEDQWRAGNDGPCRP